ncbi:MAG TPA: hypothetical protein VNC22_00375 [Sporichthya sp.]|nr:hypothetical protein [Sporichthya sp.]
MAALGGCGPFGSDSDALGAGECARVVAENNSMLRSQVVEVIGPSRLLKVQEYQGSYPFDACDPDEKDPYGGLTGFWVAGTRPRAIVDLLDSAGWKRASGSEEPAWYRFGQAATSLSESELDEARTALDTSYETLVLRREALGHTLEVAVHKAGILALVINQR